VIWRFRLLLLLVLLFSAGPAVVHTAAAQQPGDAGAATADDPWGFEDEEEVIPGWSDVLRAQAVDIGLTTALIGFALFSFQRRSRVLKYATLALTVAYLGVVKSTMISVTDIFRFVESGRAIMAIPAGEHSMASIGSAFASGFPNLKDSIAWYIFAGFTVVSTVIWGRLYCGRICAFGAFTQLLDVAVPRQLRREPPPWLERRASLIKFGLLGAVVLYYIFTSHTNVYRYVEPFWMYTRSATPLLWGMLAVLLLATLVVRNLYCRFLCPVGAMLGIIAKATTVLPIKRWSECKTCKICEKACEWGAIQGPTIVKTECVRCDDCERIYRDEKSCVHHLMIAKHQKWEKQGIPLKVIS
jgi:NosR/NirI family transcriptional regulator, nitrous oxide reductase regulator